MPLIIQTGLKKHKHSCSIKHLSNFWRSLGMLLVNYKTRLELNWIEDCILSSVGDYEICKITDDKLHVLIVTLPTRDNVNLTKQLTLINQINQKNA